MGFRFSPDSQQPIIRLYNKPYTMVKNKLKILMIDSLVGNDYSIFLCNELSRLGVDVTLVMPKDREINLQVYFTVLYLMPSKKSNQSKLQKIVDLPLYFFSLVKLCFTKNFDFIHYQFFRFKGLESLFFFILRLLPIKIAHTAHDVILVNEKSIYTFFNKIIYRLSHLLIVHSETNKNYLITNYNTDSTKISVMPHGSFDYYGELTTDDFVSARIKHGIPIDEFTVLFFGFIKEYKGLDILIKSLYTIKNYNITLVIAGEFENIELKIKVEEYLAQLPANISVKKFFGFIDQKEVGLVFSLADLVILPYKTISHSGVLHVAYSFSKPVLVTNVGDFAESVEDNKSGFIVEPNENSLCKKINEILDQKHDLKKMGEYARQLNNKKYSWQSSAKTLLQIYKN